MRAASNLGCFKQLLLVLTCDRLHLVKGSDPLVAERNPDRSNWAEDADVVELLLDLEANGHFSSFSG